MADQPRLAMPWTEGEYRTTLGKLLNVDKLVNANALREWGVDLKNFPVIVSPWADSTGIVKLRGTLPLQVALVLNDEAFEARESTGAAAIYVIVAHEMTHVLQLFEGDPGSAAQAFDPKGGWLSTLVVASPRESWDAEHDDIPNEREAADWEQRQAAALGMTMADYRRMGKYFDPSRFQSAARYISRRPTLPRQVHIRKHVRGR
jgi:hypothetical protein